MKEKEFNLLHEPWILVMKTDGEQEEVSLLELFRKAHEFKRLAGELPTQDVAVLRLLLAVLHAVFSRYGVDGSHSLLTTPETALRRWKTLRDAGAFPMPIVEDYLQHYSERFWLIHPEHPFYQVADLKESTDYTAAKLNGELSESGNKVRLFPQRTGDKKNTLSLSEATRWILYINAFDDTSSKPKGKDLPSPGVGWLGKLGLIIAVGDNLFETLLLNLVLLKDGANELWMAEKPVWEAEIIRSAERTEIAMPDNPSELLTLQSRRLLLRCEGDTIIGYSLLGGDFFSRENAFNEQMTVWRNATEKNSSIPKYTPRRHDPSRQLWRDFSVLIEQKEGSNNSEDRGNHRPGIISWVARLKAAGLIPSTFFRFQIDAAKYGDKDFFIDDVFRDTLSFNADLLTAFGENWVSRIIGEIGVTERLVEQVGYLARDLGKAQGDKDGENQKNHAKEQAYYRLDIPFRRWLERIDPKKDAENMEQICDEWREEAKKIVRKLGKILVEDSSAQAFVGRYVKEKIKGKEVERHYIAPELYNQFLSRTSLKNERR